MPNSQAFKLVAENIYFLILDNIKACSSCGEGIVDTIHQQNISCDAKLILDTGSHRCSYGCNDIFLSSMSHFKSIAYIVGDETGEHDPFAHAAIVRSATSNTHYFASYDDAYSWSLTQ